MMQLSPLIFYAIFPLAQGGLPQGAGSLFNTSDKAFLSVYNHFENTFDKASFDKFKMQAVSAGYRYVPKGPHCDHGKRAGPAQATKVGAFPGGSVKRLFGRHSHKICFCSPVASILLPGFDLGKMVTDITNKAQGASGAAAGPPAT